MSTLPIVPIVHAAQLVAFRDDIPNVVGFCFRCCGDPRTDSWLTVYNPHAVDVEAAKTYHQNKVQQIHDRKLTIEAQIDSLIAGATAVSVLDLASSAHSVTIISHEHIADEIIRIQYKCCGVHDHSEIIHRLWNDQKQPADVSKEVGQHRLNAALGHANKLAASALKASAKL